MKVTIKKGNVHTVAIQGEMPGKHLRTLLTLSPADAYALLRALEVERKRIADLANYYYDCKDCGQTHHRSVATCPTIEADDGSRGTAKWT